MSTPRFRVISTFSGVGGLDLGLERAGMHVVAQCEQDEYKRAVLAAHWRDTPCGTDVRRVRKGDDSPRPTRGPARRRTVGSVGDAPSDSGPLHDGEEPDRDALQPTRTGSGERGRGRQGRTSEPAGSIGGLEPDADSGDAEDASAPWFDITGRVDMLTGGFPCQDVSVAGKRAGLAGERTGLFHEFARIAAELQPRWLLLENVPGLLTSNSGRDFGVVLGTLADLGYSVAWRVLDARYFGVPQRRRRVFIVGHLGGDDRSALRPLCEGCDGHPPTLNCTWQTHPPTPESGTGTPSHPVAPTLTAHHKRLSGPDEAMVIDSLLASRGGPDSKHAEAGQLGAHTLRANAPTSGRRDDGNVIANTLLSHSGRNQIEETLVAGFHMTQDPISTEERSPALRAQTGGMGVIERAGVRRLTPVECERLMGWPSSLTIEGSSSDHIRAAIQSFREEASAAFDPSGALRRMWEHAESRAASPRHPEPSGGGSRSVRKAPRPLAPTPSSDGGLHHLRIEIPSEASAALAYLRGGVPEGVWAPFGPQALGCQARIDGWTAPPGVRAPDSRRYHACGDGVVANVAEWIGRRILATHNHPL